MRELSLTTAEASKNQAPKNTFCIYGPTRTGKTHFAATMIRPFIIADVVESGWQTIKEMDRSHWFEPNVEPIVVGIDAMNDISQLQPRLVDLINKKRVYTIVFDAFTYYADYFLAALIRATPAGDNRQIYGNLGKHLREVRTLIGSLGASVCYNCLVQMPEEGSPVGGPMIPGKNADKFAAGVDFLWYARSEAKRENGKIVAETRMLHTRQYGAYVAGNRLGTRADLLPDPLIGNYSTFLEALGYDVEAIRKSLPPIGAIKPSIQPVAKPAAKPLVITNNPAPKANSPTVNNTNRPQGAK